MRNTMLTLYSDVNCPFCQRVLQVAENLNVTFDIKELSEDESLRTELIERGGKDQVPFLVDAETGKTMYESGDIIEYIRDNYANTSGNPVEAAKPRVHISNSVCESCEG